MTRRVVKPQLNHCHKFTDGIMRPQIDDREIPCPYGTPGDRLWVRETWFCDNPATAQDALSRMEGVYFKATEASPHLFKWRPSIFMPRWASRITLEIAGVRVERLQEITEEDARAEGVDAHPPSAIDDRIYRRPFEVLWDSINGKIYPWASNPWVWVIEFKRYRENLRFLV